MEDFSLRTCLIPELLKNKIDFRILKYENGNPEKPESLVICYKYIDICRVDRKCVRGSTDCYDVVWHSKTPGRFDTGYARAFDLVHDIRKVMDFNFKGEDKMNKKMYRVSDMSVTSSTLSQDEITLTVKPLRSQVVRPADCDRIREAIESIKTHDDSIDALRYCKEDIISTYRLIQMFNKTSIKDVIFNNPATIVFWGDGTKTVVKAENEEFDPEKGLAMAIAKKALGNNYGYYDIFKKYVGKYEKKQKKGN